MKPAARPPQRRGPSRGPCARPGLGLIQLLATLHDEHGNTTVDGLDATQTWTGVEYPAALFRQDANVLDGVRLMGDGSVADLLWARPSATVLGMGIPSVAGLVGGGADLGGGAGEPAVAAPGMTGAHAQDALVATCVPACQWGLHCEIDRVAVGDPFTGTLSGPAFEAMRSSMGGRVQAPHDHRGAGRLDPALQRVRRGVVPDPLRREPE